MFACLSRPKQTAVYWHARPPSAVARIVRSVVALDRVQERRRAVALAHHYRDEYQPSNTRGNTAQCVANHSSGISGARDPLVG